MTLNFSKNCVFGVFFLFATLGADVSRSALASQTQVKSSVGKSVKRVRFEDTESVPAVPALGYKQKVQQFLKKYVNPVARSKMPELAVKLIVRSLLVETCWSKQQSNKLPFLECPAKNAVAADLTSALAVWLLKEVGSKAGKVLNLVSVDDKSFDDYLVIWFAKNLGITTEEAVLLRDLVLDSAEIFVEETGDDRAEGNSVPWQKIGEKALVRKASPAVIKIIVERLKLLGVNPSPEKWAEQQALLTLLTKNILPKLSLRKGLYVNARDVSTKFVWDSFKKVTGATDALSEGFVKLYTKVGFTPKYTKDFFNTMINVFGINYLNACSDKSLFPGFSGSK